MSRLALALLAAFAAPVLADEATTAVPAESTTDEATLPAAEAPAAVAPQEASELASLEIAALTGTFEDLASDFGTVETGGVAIDLRSPRNRLVVHRNRLALRPAPNGAWAGLLEVEIEGDGDLEAEIEGSGRPLDDHIVAPRQTVRVGSELRLDRDPEGYRITFVDPPPSVPVAIDSDLGRRLSSLCDGLAFFLGLDCGDLDRSFRTVDVPMPAAGESFVVPAERLTADERAFFDARLAGR